MGDQSVGKTHILHQYVKGSLPQNAQATLGVDFHSKLINLPNPENEQEQLSVKLSIYDTAGEEKFQAVTACHYRNAKGCIVVYDVTSRRSFENIERWLRDAR